MTTSEEATSTNRALWERFDSISDDHLKVTGRCVVRHDEPVIVVHHRIAASLLEAGGRFDVERDPVFRAGVRIGKIVHAGGRRMAGALFAGAGELPGAFGARN